MTKNITLMGASYSDVPGVELPQTGGGTAYFADTSPTTATASDVASGKVFFLADGTQETGTAASAGGLVITDTTDTHGGTIRTITGTTIAGTKSITANGTNIDVTSYAAVDVAVPAPSPNLQTKTNIDPTESTQTISADTGYDGLDSVQLNAIPSSYVGSGVTQRDSSDLSASGATVTAPAGYYSSAATTTVTSGTAGTPTATKGTVSNHSVSVTPSVTNTTGYITGSTKTGTAVTVSASELVSGSETKTANGTYDVTNLASLVVNVSGSSKNVQCNQSTSRTTSTSLTSLNSFTCSTAGKYDVYWSCMRSSTSGTWSSQLYIGGTATGDAQATWSNHVQNVHLTNITIAKNQTVAVYARSRGSNYYAYVPQVTIVQTS